MIDHIINGKKKNQLINSFRSILTGSVTGSGTPFLVHAKTLAQDGLMGYFSTANMLSADQANIKRFRYYGTIIKTSRSWCQDHVGKEYTKSEINKFDDSTWAGKKSGSTLINRGGWGCRHSWLGIVE